jgi:hypothetical protein
MCLCMNGSKSQKFAWAGFGLGTTEVLNAVVYPQIQGRFIRTGPERAVSRVTVGTILQVTLSSKRHAETDAETSTH